MPVASDLLPQDRDRRILRVLSAAGEVGKPFVANLSVPHDPRAILRRAFAAMVTDPAFIADAAKERQPVHPDPRRRGGENLNDIYSTPADVVPRRAPWQTTAGTDAM